MTTMNKPLPKEFDSKPYQSTIDGLSKHMEALVFEKTCLSIAGVNKGQTTVF